MYHLSGTWCLTFSLGTRCTRCYGVPVAELEKWADTASLRRSTRLAGHRAPRRALIIRAAAEAIELYGDEAGTGQIAEIAGVARPHVYRHFSSRDELLLEVARYAAGDLKARVRPTLSRSGKPLDVIAGPVGESVDWAAEHPGLYRFITARKQTRDLHRDRLGRTHFLSEIVEAANLYLQAHGIPAGSHDGIMAGLMGMVDASIIWWLDHRDEPRDDLVDRLTRQVWLVLADMLTAFGVEDPEQLTLDLP
jgi:AcrR family transcriptional regulator